MNKVFYFEDPQSSAEGQPTVPGRPDRPSRPNQAADAEQKLKASLEINPTMNPGTRHNLALAYMTQGKWDMAKQELEMGIQKTQAMKEAEDPAKAASFRRDDRRFQTADRCDAPAQNPDGS